MNKLLTKIAGLSIGLAMAIGVGISVGGGGKDARVVNANPGDEITSISGIVSGKSYYIKGVRSSKTYYLTFSDSTGSQSGTEATSTSSAVALTFTKVTDGYNITTPNGNYIAPGTSNGKINVSATAIKVSASNQNNKIRLSITSGGNTWSIQKNTSAANFGGYKNTQSDITLVEAGTLYSITTSITNGTYSGSTSIASGGSASVTITPSSGYKLPASVTVTGATQNYDSSTGVVSLSNPTGAVTISATCTALKSYTITTTLSNCTKKAGSATSIFENSEATLTFEGNDGYDLPASLSPVGASVKSWNASTGVLVLQNPTANVTLTVTATEHINVDTYGYDGKTLVFKSNSNVYIPKTISTSSTSRPSATNSESNAAVFLFTLVGDDTFTLKLMNGDNAGKFLVCSNGTTSNSDIYVSSTSQKWTIFTNTDVSPTEIYLKNKDRSNRYISSNGTTDWRMYDNKNGSYKMTFSEKSLAPAITKIELTGSPASSANVNGDYEWSMSAKVFAENDEQQSLSRDVEWSVSPEEAVSFSKTTSTSEESITVKASNTANSNVVITATSKATGFTSIHGDSNQFNIIKVYYVSSVSLSYTTEGGPNYDADGASSFEVEFNTSVNYTGDTGTEKVNISVSPDTGVSGQGNNKNAGEFTLTFTKNGNYTVTSTSAEDGTKSQSVNISISNIVVPGFEKITSATNLREGSQLIVYSAFTDSSSNNHYKVMNTTDKGNNRGYVNHQITNDFIPQTDVSESMEIITLESTGDGYWYLKTSANEYLYAVSGKNYLKTRDSHAEDTDDEKFTISFPNGVAAVSPKIDSSRRIQYNHSDSIFSLYGGTQKDIELYLKIDTSPYFTISATSAYIGVRGTQTLTVTAHNGARANISWSASGQNISIPASSTGTSVVVTGVTVGDGVVTASFTALDEQTYTNLTCTVNVVAVDDYVNIGVTTFTKVTSTPVGGWTGTYLIVDDTPSLATKICFDGSVGPLTGDAKKAVTISNDTIDATASMISSSFNIKESTNSGYYNVRSNSGYYIGGTDKSIYISIGEAYDVTISNSGIITGGSSSTLRHQTSQGDFFRFYSSDTGNALSLYKANGERRAITSTITAWYDNAKTNNYLVCDMSGVNSKINWTNLSSGSLYTALTSTDKDTLKRMTAKSAEDNGNYLEDFISDYDYLVSHKGYTDFLGRFEIGGAMHGQKFVGNSLIGIINKNASVVIVAIITSLVSAAAIGGYFYFRRRKEQ